MSYLGEIFGEAIRLVREDPDLKGVYSSKRLPSVYVDCGNTLFFRKAIEPTEDDLARSVSIKYEITTNEAMLNFVIALKDAGYPVQLMSDEPLRYLDILHAELKARGKPEFFFEDEHGLTILRKQLINQSMQGLILIDNDRFSVPVQIKRRLFLNDPKFVEALESFRNFVTAVLPECMKPSALWNREPKVMFG